MATIYWTGAVSGDLATAGNWSGGAAPAGGDTVIFTNNSVSVDDGLDTSAATYAKLIIDGSYTGTIGTRSESWVVGATIAEIGSYRGLGTPTYSGLLKLDFTNIQTTCYVYGSAAASTDGTGMSPVRLLCNEATTVIHVRSGNVSIAEATGTSSALLQLYIGYRSDATNGPTVHIGSGATVSGISQYSGTATFIGIGTGVAVYGGAMTVDTSDALGTVGCYGGTTYLDNHGTITSITVEGGTADWSRTANARTITTLVMNPGSTLRGIESTLITLTNKVDANKPVTITATAY